MSKRLVNPKAPNAPVNAKETRAPNGKMPADMKADAEARALGRIPIRSLLEGIVRDGRGY